MRTLMLCVTLGVTVWSAAAFADDRGVAHNRAFLQAFLTRCIPAAHSQQPIVPDGMTQLPPDLAQEWLQGQEGKVWKYDTQHDVLVASDRPDHCFVVSKYSDIANLQDQVGFWFSKDALGFDQEAFEAKPSGEFRASYVMDQGDGWRRRILIQARPVPDSGGIAIMGTAGFVPGK